MKTEETNSTNSTNRTLAQQREQERELFAELYQIAGVLFHEQLVPRLLLDKLSAAQSGVPIPAGDLLPFDIPELRRLSAPSPLAKIEARMDECRERMKNSGGPSTQSFKETEDDFNELAAERAQLKRATPSPVELGPRCPKCGSREVQIEWNAAGISWAKCLGHPNGEYCDANLASGSFFPAPRPDKLSGPQPRP